MDTRQDQVQVWGGRGLQAITEWELAFWGTLIDIVVNKVTCIAASEGNLRVAQEDPGVQRPAKMWLWSRYLAVLSSGSP